MNYYLSTDPGFVVTMSTVEPPYPFTTSHFNTATSPVDSDVPGIAWAQASGLGWASHGSGLPKHEPGLAWAWSGLSLGLIFKNLLNGSVPLI